MASLTLFQIDAFTSQAFKGNPAAVCPLESWLDDDTLQAIAQENNLSETAFFVPEEDAFRIRWFTPSHEVQLCGHATLASAFVILTELDTNRSSVRFDSASGPLWIRRDGDRLTMDFPTWRLKPCAPPDTLIEGLGRTPVEVYTVESEDNFFAVFNSESEVVGLNVDFALLAQLHPAGVAVTAPGETADCVSRYFAPSYGIPEDPVTGSIHCGLVPLWASRLNKSQILAHQVSQRGGELFCEDNGDRVLIGGEAVKYLEGTVYLP